jgi:NAD(P)-dependent dehydrogenase (short-subunit alcohol dehydrogenase family)
MPQRCPASSSRRSACSVPCTPCCSSRPSACLCWLRTQDRSSAGLIAFSLAKSGRSWMSLLIEALQGLVPEKGLIGIMSSGQGSVANNEKGGHEVYRGTKAALSAYMRSYAARHAEGARASAARSRLVSNGTRRTACALYHRRSNSRHRECRDRQTRQARCAISRSPGEDCSLVSRHRSRILEGRQGKASSCRRPRAVLHHRQDLSRRAYGAVDLDRSVIDRRMHRRQSTFRELIGLELSKAY